MTKKWQFFVSTLFVSFLLCVFFVSCIDKVQHRLPTGVERIDSVEKKTIQLVATGMASKNAIDKDSTAMMQTTSCEAARLLLNAELEKPEYSKIRDKFDTPQTLIIDRGLYCRLFTTYSKIK